eukprot:m51a1_g10280 hypothetical protein (80) ;mRNA; f:80704-81069
MGFMKHMMKEMTGEAAAKRHEKELKMQYKYGHHCCPGPVVVAPVALPMPPPPQQPFYAAPYAAPVYAPPPPMMVAPPDP